MFMKKFFFAFCLVAGFAACNTADKGSPSATIDGMFTAMKSGNIEEMKKFITKTDIAILEAGEKLMASIDPEAVTRIKEKISTEFKDKVKDVKYSLKNEKIDGDKATVDAEVTENGKTSTHNFNLVKEEGAWKVALSKSGDGMFNSMKGDMGAEMNDANEALERLKQMDPDSLKMLMNKGLEALDSLSKKKKEN
jgi:hypothetical protein